MQYTCVKVLTVAEVRLSLSPYAGSGNVFLDRLNEVCARLIQSGNYRKEEVRLTVYADAEGVSIVSVPRQDTILAGALSTSNALCTGAPMGVRNGWAPFDKNGLGYGGLTNDFTEVFGEFAVFNEWSEPMRIRLRPEVSEIGTVYLSGTLNGRDVWALNNATWEKREAVAFNGYAPVTSTQYFDAEGFRAKKPATSGRIFVYTLDDDAVETLVAIWDAPDTLPRYHRYRVPQCEDVSPVTSASSSATVDTVSLDSMFADAGDLTVNSAGTTVLSYLPFYSKSLRIIAQAGDYTRNFTFGTTTPKSGAVFRVSLEVAASATIILNFYNESTSGTLLQIVTGDSSNVQYETLVFSFNGIAWRFAGREV